MHTHRWETPGTGKEQEKCDRHTATRMINRRLTAHMGGSVDVCLGPRQVHDHIQTRAGTLGMLVAAFATSLGPENDAKQMKAEGSDGGRQIPPKWDSATPKATSVLSLHAVSEASPGCKHSDTTCSGSVGEEIWPN